MPPADRNDERDDRRLAEDLAAIVWVSTLDGECSYVNRYGREFLGLASDSPIPAWSGLVHPDDMPVVQDAWDGASRAGAAYEVEYRLRRADGEYRWVLERGQPRRGGDGAILAWAGTCTDVEEHKRAERASERERAFSEILLATIPGIVCLVDRGGRLVRWNREYERVLGCSPEELLGSDVLGPVVDEDKPALARKLAALFEGGGFDQAEGRVRNARGEVRDFIYSGRRIEISGEPYVVATGLDVTARKRAEAFAESVIETANVLFLQLDGAGIVRRLNPAAQEITGYSRAELEGTSWLDVLVPKDRYPHVWAELERIAMPGELPEIFESPLLTKSGEERQILWKNGTLREGERIVGTIAFGMDVTDRKRAEEQNARLVRVVEQTTESIVITDPLGTILYVNPAFERVSGYPAAEAIGRNPRILKGGHQDAAFYRRMWETLARGEVWEGRLVNRRKDGTLFEEHATIGPVRDGLGHLVNYVAVKRDVTKETRLERQLIQAQKMEAVGRLAGGVAHDFNNLLGVILGYAEITRRRLPDDDPLKDKVDQILNAAERAAGLTRQLLAFSRLQVLQPRVLDLNVVVSNLERMLRRLIGEDVELRTRLDPGLGSVKADPGQIEQVIMNLAVNSRDAMPQGGRLTIELQNADLDAGFAASHPFVRPGRYVMLAVSDTGAGMDAETQAHAFEPFFTTKEQGKGTGLGLSTVYGIVKQSEGHVLLYSEVGVGTSLKIYLPRVDAKAVEAPAERAAPLARGNETLLLTEDEPSLREVVCETLEGGGYTVLVARQGAEAVQIADEYPGVIHAMVTDVIMPGMTGPETAARIMATRPELKVLYVSGYTDEAVARTGMLSPGAALLSKPFTVDSLLREVRDLLERP